MAEFKGGCFGKVLEIDLSARTFKARPLSDEQVQKVIGGRGLGAYYAITEYKAGKNPLDEDAFIYVGVGPLNGTACPSTRTSFVNKSPYTGLMGHAETGAHFGNEIKWAGWDGIYIKGRSARPVWIKIENDKVEFKDASKMWGKTTEEAHEMILKETNDPYTRTAVIGPAGENGVPFACVVVERFRAAGRSGTGLLMGNKKLKGISVRGTKFAVPVADNAKFLAAARDAKERLIAKEAWQGIKRWGTGGLLEIKHFHHGSLITRNFQTTWYPDIVKIGGEEAARRFWKRHVACSSCPVHCLKLGVLRQGKYAGLIAEGPEYESGGVMGSNLGIKTFEEMIALVEYADALGLDNISTGGVLGFATEALEKGMLKPADLDELKPRWGDGDTYMEMMKKMAYKDGKAGKLMSLGVAKMAKKIGKGTDAFANTVKGKELAAHDPRGDKIRAYSYCMGTSGGDHHEGQGPKALAMTAIADSSCQCTFASFLCWGGDTDKVTAGMLNPLLGWNWTPEHFWKVGKAICTLERVFNVREGISSKDDVLPRRMKTEALPAGPKKGVIFTAEDEKKMHSETYGFFGWDEKGIPTEATLKAYGIDFLIDDVNAAKKKFNL